ncbi:hypothetical protein ABZ070_36465 [Streptomyces sp. NPDC006283]
MPTMVVELHVPLLPTPNLADGAHPFRIEEVDTSWPVSKTKAM